MGEKQRKKLSARSRRKRSGRPERKQHKKQRKRLSARRRRNRKLTATATRKQRKSDVRGRTWRKTLHSVELISGIKWSRGKKERRTMRARTRKLPEIATLHNGTPCLRSSTPCLSPCLSGCPRMRSKTTWHKRMTAKSPRPRVR